VRRFPEIREEPKKSRGLLRAGVEVKFGFVATHRGIWPITVQCGALGVSRSGFYAWRRRAPSARARTDAQILQTIRASFALSDQTYGARRMLTEVRAAGHSCGRQRVTRLMRSAALRARPRRRALPADPGARALHLVAPNVLAREFTATAPNQKWVADFTYIWTHEGWLYVAVVLDLFSRRVVGWSMQAEMTAQLVTDALLMAVWRRGPATALLHHSDQGSQYTSESFQRLLHELGVSCSMSRSGNVWDNSVMESFFSTLKIERCDRRTYLTRDHARADIFDYIERFYNPLRRHSTLHNQSPVAFEQAMAVR
jgi:putative transposase